MDSKKKTTGLYIHIPFCIRKCAYCDFYSVTDLSVMDRYIDALCAHIAALRDSMDDRVFDTVYLGGGTPGLLSAARMDRLFDAILSCFSVAGDAEITAEINPAAVSREDLIAYRQTGINRLSIGLQSANDGELQKLSRLHDFAGFSETYRHAREAGFDNISVDLMYGLPDQCVDGLLNSIRTLCERSPEHISLYGLKIEENTPFGRMGDRLILPDEDSQCEMYELAVDLLAENGYSRYEISNFAKKGYESRHNLRYWQCGDYLGLGPAAHSYMEGVRYGYARDLSGYMEALEQGRTPEKVDQQVITPDERVRETIMLGLRLEAGISADEKLLEKAKKYLSAGYMRYENDRLSFTTKGFLVSNPILADLLDE